MRIAILADIHGNSIALDAVLTDIRARGGVDLYWVLGDYAVFGPDPIGVLERIEALPAASCCLGNTDRYIALERRLFPPLEEVRSNPAALPPVVDVLPALAWAQGAVTAAGWMDWLASLPIDLRLELPDGTRLLGAHNSPGCDDGQGIHPALRPAEVEALVAGRGADLVCVGHTHWALDLTVGGVRAVNVGSVSNPLPPDLRAGYVLLEASREGYTLRALRVDYDREAVVAEAERLRHPGLRRLAQYMHGERKPAWG